MMVVGWFELDVIWVLCDGGWLILNEIWFGLCVMMVG
jgi:hypothetical protein